MAPGVTGPRRSPSAARNPLTGRRRAPGYSEESLRRPRRTSTSSTTNGASTPPRSSTSNDRTTALRPEQDRHPETKKAVLTDRSSPFPFNARVTPTHEPGSSTSPQPAEGAGPLRRLRLLVLGPTRQAPPKHVSPGRTDYTVEGKIPRRLHQEELYAGKKIGVLPTRTTTVGPERLKGLDMGDPGTRS